MGALGLLRLLAMVFFGFCDSGFRFNCWGCFRSFGLWVWWVSCISIYYLLVLLILLLFIVVGGCKGLGFGFSGFLGVRFAVFCFRGVLWTDRG